jgi:glycosyltransferase involved in cell wall biosynthesis
VPTLHVGRPAGKGTPVPTQSHVTLALVNSPDVRVWGSRGIMRAIKLTGKLYGQLVFAARCLAPIARWRPDIVELGGLVPLPLGLLCKIFLRVRLTAIVIGTDVVMLARSRLLRRLARHVDVLFYVSAEMETVVRNVGASATRLTPWGVDLEQFSPGDQTRDETIVAVSRLDGQKGLDYTIRAFTKIADDRSEARLLIAGEGPDRARLMSIAAKEPHAGRITFLGPLGQDKIAELLSTSRVMVLASPDVEGTPKVVLEAMASGLPVVSSDVGGCRKLLGGGAGVLVRPRDIDAIADAVLAVLRDPEAWKRMSDIGQVEARGYSWDGIAQDVLDIYEQLLDQPATTGKR